MLRSDPMPMKLWYLGQCVVIFQYWRICVDIGRDARSLWSSERMDAARERYRDVVTTGASEKERTTGGHIWSRGPRGSQVTPASDGASRFHDDVRRVSLSLFFSPLSIWESHLFSPLVASLTPSFLRASRSRLLRVGHQKYRRLFRGWERRGGPREKNRREALFRDYRGLPAFWNRADRLHSQYRTFLVSMSRNFCDFGFLPFGFVRFRSCDCRGQYVDSRSQRNNIYSFRLFFALLRINNISLY